jgi:hypothetical protein
LKEALQWLQLAIDLAGKKDIRLMALNNPDLEPLPSRNEISRPSQRPSSARIHLANKSPTILLFIPAESGTKTGAMDDQRLGIISEQRSQTGGQHD